MARSPEAMADAMLANMASKTGKTLAQWLTITKVAQLTKHGAITKLLKSEHGVSHGYANLIAHKTLEAQAGVVPGQADLVAQQYAGAKASLRPIYDALIKAVARFGADVEIAPKRAYVSLRRSKQLALIQPSTTTRVDVGIQFKDEPATARLEKSGSFNAMVSHRVRLTDLKEVDQELIGWLKEAFQQA